MNDWTVCTLGELGEIVGGATPSTKRQDYYEGEIPWITPKDLSTFEGRYISRGERNISSAGLVSCSAKLMPPNTVLFTSRAPIGYIAIAKNEVSTNQGFKSIVPNDRIDYLFLYYLLQYNKDKIEGLGSGTTFKEVSGKTMKGVTVQIPKSIAKQKRIAAVLDSLDSTIEVNRRINDNLQTLIQAVFQKNIENKPRLNCLSDICHFSNNKVNVADLTVDEYLSTENILPNKQGFVPANNLPTLVQTTSFEPGDVLISNIRPYFKKIVYCYKEGGCSTDVLCFKANERILSAYLYSTLYDDLFFEHMVIGSKGTKMPRGDKQQIMQYPIYIPTYADLLAFNEITNPMLTNILINNTENQRLADLRDALLPRLMSGELDVSEVEL